MAATAAPTDAVYVSGDSLHWWSRTASVDYGFCSVCGSTLFWRAADRPGHLSIAAGTLDAPTGLTTTLALFVDEASDYHELQPGLHVESGDRELGSGPAYSD